MYVTFNHDRTPTKHPHCKTRIALYTYSHNHTNAIMTKRLVFISYRLRPLLIENASINIGTSHFNLLEFIIFIIIIMINFCNLNEAKNILNFQ